MKREDGADFCRVRIKITLAADGPVLVASGAASRLHPELPDVSFLTSRNGGVETYVIPGSSLKGIIRHYLYSSYADREVDRLFGYAGRDDSRRSRAAFSDLFADMDSVQTSVRSSTAIGSISQSASRGSLNNCLAVIRGDFSGTIRMSNVKKSEVGMIIEALGAIDRRELFIGGRSSRGFGRMRVAAFEMTAAKSYDPQTMMPEIDSADSFETALDLLN